MKKLHILLFLFFSGTTILFCYGESDNISTQPPFLSVIIPVYNAQDSVSECLDSVVNQTFKDIEIICIDDGSTDGSLDILLKYRNSDNRVNIIKQCNNGVSSARNCGLTVANGEYVSFVDADDTVDVDGYEICYTHVLDSKPDILMFGEKRLRTSDVVYDNPFDVFLRASYIPVWNKLYKNSFLKENNFKFYEKAKCFNDDCFNSVVIPKAKVIKSISNKFYNYKRNKENSIQTAFSAKDKIDGTLIYAKYVLKNWQKNNYRSEQKDLLVGRIFCMFNRYLQKLSPLYDRELYLNRLYRIINSE